MAKEGVSVSLWSLQKLYKKFSEHGCVLDLPQRKRSEKLTPEMEEMLDEEMWKNNELVKNKTERKVPFLEFSLSTVKVARRRGWVCAKPHYCQILRAVNKTKRLEWCQKQLEDKEDFSVVIFTDECWIIILAFASEKTGNQELLHKKTKHPA